MVHLRSPKHIVVFGPIMGYRVLGNFIVGVVAPDEETLREQTEDIEPGYFLVDMISGEVIKGMDWASWVETAEHREIDADVTLCLPTGLHVPRWEVRLGWRRLLDYLSG